MNKRLHPTIEDFYNSILKYAGLVYDDSCNCIVNVNPKMGELTVNDKKITLPFNSNLKNPNGRTIFHPLNENYIAPESPLFLLYKKRLVCEINLKLSQLIVSLIHVANSTELQNKINDPVLVDLIAAIKGTDFTLIENFLTVISKSKVKNDEAFIVDVFLKKNGEINGTPYAATGKVLFNLQTELTFAINDPAKDSRMFGFKMRKKDLSGLQAIHSAIFGDTSQLTEYVQGSDNNAFRYLNTLLSTSYMITNIINKLTQRLIVIDDSTLMASEILSDHDWVTLLPQIYDLTSEIRTIPNQDEFIVDNKTPYRAVPVERLTVDESKVANVPQLQQANVPQLQPQLFAPQQPASLPYQQPVQQAPVAMSVEELIKMRTNAATFGHAYQQPVQQMYAPQQQAQVPQWIVAAQNNAQQLQPYVQQQPMMLQPYVTPQIIQQPQQLMQTQLFTNQFGQTVNAQGQLVNPPYQPMQAWPQGAVPRPPG